MLQRRPTFLILRYLSRQNYASRFGPRRMENPRRSGRADFDTGRLRYGPAEHDISLRPSAVTFGRRTGPRRDSAETDRTPQIRPFSAIVLELGILADQRCTMEICAPTSGWCGQLSSLLTELARARPPAAAGGGRRADRLSHRPVPLFRSHLSQPARQLIPRSGNPPASPPI